MATALLGVLLWVVLSMVRDFARGPAEPVAEVATPRHFDPTLPRISSHSELRAWLETLGQPAGDLTAYSGWLLERGYPEMAPLLREHQDSQTADYAELDDATLLVLAGRGDITSLHLLAERSLASDLLAALEWYDQAVVNGSLYAMLRLSDLYTTLADPALQAFASETGWVDGLNRSLASEPAPAERALAWALALVITGGYGVADDRLAARIRDLRSQLDSSAVMRACATAADYVLETATLRRAQGSAVFSLELPPFALSVAKPEQLNPCAVQVPPLVSFATCAATDFVGPGPQLMTAWFCP